MPPAAYAGPLTEAEITMLRSIAKGLTADEWRVLKALASGLVAARIGVGAPSNGGSSASQGDELGDSFLDSQPWADREISRDPKRWAGASMVGYRYSEAPSEWLDVQASAMEFKAQKGRESPEPRLQTGGKNAGKPWHEADAFEAKICRAWSRRNRGKTLPPPRAETGDGGSAQSNGTDVGDAYEGEFVP